MDLKKLMLVAAFTAGASGHGVAAERMPVCPDDGSTVVNLSADARRMVMQDRLQATVNFETEAKTATAAQAAVNAKMQAAKELYSRYGQSIKVSTGNYSVYKTYPHDGGPRPVDQAAREKQALWRASQQLQLDSASREDMQNLVASLQQQGFAVQGLNYYLSRPAMEALRDELADEALATIKQRAQRMAQRMDMKTIHFARIDVGGSGQSHEPRMYAMKAEMAAGDASLPAPVAQAGETEVQVSVSAEVRLK